MNTPSLTLNDGTTIPQLGFGTWQVAQDQAADVVGRALEAGYRHIDTAQGYGNEVGVGQAIRDSGIPRQEIYLTSKLNNSNHRPEEVRRSFDQSLADLRTDYLDLFLIHWPLPTRYDGDYVSTWQAMVGLLADGRLRSAGVSNFEPEHLERIIADSGVVPSVNQIEIHPYFHNRAAKQASLEHGMAVEAWSPLAQGLVLKDPVLVALAEKHGVTTAQVTLRWHLQSGNIVFPKSASNTRMRANLDIFGFELSGDDMAQIDSLDRGEAGRTGPDPRVFDAV